MIRLDIKSLFKENYEPKFLEFPEELTSLKCTGRSIQMVYSVDLANRKGSFAHTKDRGEVSGTTKKMYRQKGTGGARHGSARVGQFRGGGIIFGPKFSERKIRINKKLRALATLTCINKHIARGSLMVLDGLNTDCRKTKNTFASLGNFFFKELSNPVKEIKGFLLKTGCLFIDSKDEKTLNNNFSKSSRNLGGLKYITDSSVNVTDLLRHGVVCVTADAMNKIILSFSGKFPSINIVGA